MFPITEKGGMTQNSHFLYKTTISMYSSSSDIVWQKGILPDPRSRVLASSRFSTPRTTHTGGHRGYWLQGAVWAKGILPPAAISLFRTVSRPANPSYRPQGALVELEAIAPHLATAALRAKAAPIPPFLRVPVWRVPTKGFS